MWWVGDVVVVQVGARDLGRILRMRRIWIVMCDVLRKEEDMDRKVGGYR